MKDYRWPEWQRQRWLLLLRKRAAGVPLRGLANTPVRIWLLWGDEWIPLCQVRRAMETWAEISQPWPRHDYGREARQLVERLARPEASGGLKRQLADALADSARPSSSTPNFSRRYSTGWSGRLTLPTNSTGAGPHVSSHFEARLRFHEAGDRAYEWARAV